MIGRIAVVTVLVLAVAGCSLFRASPVPPPPPPPAETDIVDIDGRTLLERLERDDTGAIVGFGPLMRARETVAAAQWNPAVAENRGEALRRAETAIAGAESAWEAIGGAPADRPDILATIAHDSHRARRWAEIAIAGTLRETTLAEIDRMKLKLARRKAEDERWLGVELVPDRYGDIIFTPGTVRIEPASRDVIERLAEFLAVHPRYALEIRGHSDDSPPSPAALRRFLRAHPEAAERTGDVDAQVAAYNRMISLRRARAVVDALAASGFDESRLSARGFGASRPVADNDSAAGRRRNRRVEVLVIPALGWAGDYAEKAESG